MAKKKAPAAAPLIQPGLLKPQLVRLADLVEDPENARKHPPANLSAIRASLREFGQDEPLVVQIPGNVIRKGNGRYRAMLLEGWETAAAVLVQEDDARAIARGLAGNRSAELATWDETVLARLLDGIPETLSLELGWTEKELGKIMLGLGEAAPAADAPPEEPAEVDPLRRQPARMVHLYYQPDEHAEFERIAQEAADLYNLENVSQTILRALREAVAPR